MFLSFKIPYSFLISSWTLPRGTISFTTRINVGNLYYINQNTQSVVQIQIKIAQENKKGCFPYAKVSSNYTITMTSASNRLQMAGNMSQLAPGLYHLLASSPSKKKENSSCQHLYQSMKIPWPLWFMCTPTQFTKPRDTEQSDWPAQTLLLPLIIHTMGKGRLHDWQHFQRPKMLSKQKKSSQSSSHSFQRRLRERDL